MATIASTHTSAEQRERLFFFVMACVLAATIVIGFGMQAALGRSSFSAPALYHVHALAFLGWVALYVAQSALVLGNNLRLHRLLGSLALIWLPVLVTLALALTITSVRARGGPPFFGVGEFLFVNVMHIVSFAALTGAAIALWRRTDWHRRLMLCAMAWLAAPAIARMMPMPLFIPYAFPALVGASMVFPLIGLVADWRRTGRIHPAWLWGIGAVVAALLIGEALAASAWGEGVTADLIAGTPGAERPPEAFFPG
jgi:hypothetical protein